MFRIKLIELKSDKNEKLSFYLSKDKQGFFLSCYKIENLFKKRMINKSKYYSSQHIEKIMNNDYLNLFITESLKALYQK